MRNVVYKSVSREASEGVYMRANIHAGVHKRPGYVYIHIFQ